MYLCHNSINETSCASNPSKNVAALVHWALTCDLFAFSDINTAEIGGAPLPVAIVTRVNLKDLCCATPIATLQSIIDDRTIEILCCYHAFFFTNYERGKMACFFDDVAY